MWDSHFYLASGKHQLINQNTHQTTSLNDFKSRYFTPETSKKKKKKNESGTEQNISELRIILTKLGFPEAELLGLQPIKSDESSGFLKYLKQCVIFFSLPDPANQWSHSSITGKMLPSVGLLWHHHDRPSPRAALAGQKVYERLWFIWTWQRFWVFFHEESASTESASAAFNRSRWGCMGKDASKKIGKETWKLTERGGEEEEEEGRRAE